MSAEKLPIRQRATEKAKDLWLKSDKIVGIVALAVAGFGVATANTALVSGGLVAAGAQVVEHTGKKMYFNRNKDGRRRHGMIENLRRQLPTRNEPANLYTAPAAA